MTNASQLSTEMVSAGAHWFYATLHNYKTPTENAEIVYLAMGLADPSYDLPDLTNKMTEAGGKAYVEALESDASLEDNAKSIFNSMIGAA